MIDPPPVPHGTDPTLNAEQPSSGSLSPIKWLFLAGAIYFAFNFFLPLIPVPLKMSNGTKNALLIFSTLAFMLLQIWVPWRIAALKLKVGKEIVFAILFGLAWFACFVLLHYNPHLSEGANRNLYRLSSPLRAITETIALAFLGCGVSWIVREAKILLPVCLVAMIIDFVGAMTPVGLTNTVMTQHPEIVRAVSVAVPKFGALHPLSYFGPGDALFTAFFLSIVVRLRLNEKGTFWAMYVLLTITMLLVVKFGMNVAALIPMGIAVAAANIKEFRYSREETFAMVYSGVLVLLLTMGFFVYNHRHMMHHH